MGIPTLISTHNVTSATASIAITSGLDATYDEYMFVCTNVETSGDGHYFSFQVNASDDEGGDYKEVVKDCVTYLDNNFFDKGCELIVGSVRTVGNVLDCIKSGAHIVTTPPAILQKMITHQYSIFTSNQFENDYVSVEQLSGQRVGINGT